MNWQGDATVWESVKKRFPVGSDVTGPVVVVAPFGVFLDLGSGAIGLLLVPEMADDAPKQVADYPQTGQTVSAKVIHHRERERQVSLTQRM